MKKKIITPTLFIAASLCANTVYAQSNHNPSALATSASSLPAGVKSEVLNQLKISDIHLPQGNKPLVCRKLRFRTVDVKPGSHIDLHSHENRPAMLGVTRGESIVYPYQHSPVTLRLGDSYKEYQNVHYAKNGSATEMLTMTTFDLLDDGSSCNGMVYPQRTPLLNKLKQENNPYYRDAPKEGGLEKSNPVYGHYVYDIKLPRDGARLADRIMRVKKITLPADAVLPEQDFSNRPSYLLVLDGSLNITKSGAKKAIPVQKLGTADLVNTGKTLIKNGSKTEPAHYLIFELWDPKDTNAI